MKPGSETMYRGVLTGGPGVGKTTALEVLAERGILVGEDAARSIIRERKAAGLSPRPDPREFGEEILKREIESYESATRSPAFFERGVADVAGSLYGAGVLNEEEAAELIDKYRYNQAFVFPPWEEIYCMDEERDHTFEHSVRVYESTLKWYRRHGYELIEVPVGSAESRADFILTQSRRIQPAANQEK